LPKKNNFHTRVVSLTCRKILRHVTDEFSSLSKEVMLRISVALKNPSSSAGLETAYLRSNGKRVTSISPKATAIDSNLLLVRINGKTYVSLVTHFPLWGWFLFIKRYLHIGLAMSVCPSDCSQDSKWDPLDGLNECCMDVIPLGMHTKPVLFDFLQSVIPTWWKTEPVTSSRHQRHLTTGPCHDVWL
jgi:hypothetical protein